MSTATTDSPTLLADSRWQGRIFTGEWNVALGGTHEVREPANGKSLGKVGHGNEQDIASACKAAARSQAAWAATAPRERSAHEKP